MSFIEWDPKEWERHVNALASLRHGKANYQEVPDKHKGDYGIEGFSPDDKIAYQAYAPQEPLSTKDRYEKQRAKITTDINKFVNNQKDLEDLLGQTVIEKWVLIVPQFDSAELVKHAQKKAAELREKSLVYISDDFKIIIETDGCFAEEKQKLIASGAASLDLEVDQANGTKIKDWSDQNNELVKTIDKKLKKLERNHDQANIIQQREYFIKRHIEGQNLLTSLKNEYPDFWEKLHKYKIQREDELVIANAVHSEGASKRLRDEIQVMEVGFKETMSSLTPAMVKQLSYEAISDWIIRCPLDFKGEN